MSQSPRDDKPTPEYVKGWIILKKLILEEGASFSGRERNFVYRNLGDGSFADVSAISGADAVGDGRALATIDWDDDGRLDLLLRNRTAPRVQLFRNLCADGGGFVTVDLEGVTCNRDAIGAQVTLEVGGRTLRRTLHAGDGFLAQSSRRLHFGIGTAARVDRLTVRWPDGGTATFRDLAVDTRYSIRQGELEPRVLPARTTGELAAVSPKPLEGSAEGATRLALAEKLPLSPVGLPGFDDPDRTIGELAGSPVLLTCWSTTCAACFEEFAGFLARAADIERAGLRIVTLCLDGEEDPARARELLARYGLDSGAGYVDADLRIVLERVFLNVVGFQRETPLPTSLLLDSHGQLVAIYFGKVAVDALLADVAVVHRMDPRDLSDTRLVPGRRLALGKRGLGRLAKQMRKVGQDDLARFYRELVR